MVSVHGGLYVEFLQIEGHERDVAQGVVFPQTGAADVGNGTESLADGKLCGFGQVVVFLFLDSMNQMPILLLDA